MRSINSGGSTVDTSHYDSLTWSNPQQGSKGTRKLRGHSRTSAAIDYISNIDLDAVHEHEVSLNRVMTSILKDVNGLRIIGPKTLLSVAEFAQFYWIILTHMT